MVNTLIYPDTNILINQTLAFIKKGKRLYNKLNEDYKVYLLLTKDKKFKQIISQWSILEFIEVLNVLWFKRKLITINFHPEREYNEAKRLKITLEKKEHKEINGFVKGLRKDSVVKTTKVRVQRLARFQRHGFEVYDSILYLQANELSCDYFLSRDEDLQRINSLRGYTTKVIHPTEFLQKLKNQEPKAPLAKK